MRRERNPTTPKPPAVAGSGVVASISSSEPASVSRLSHAAGPQRRKKYNASLPFWIVKLIELARLEGVNVAAKLIMSYSPIIGGKPSTKSKEAGPLLKELSE